MPLWMRIIAGFFLHRANPCGAPSGGYQGEEPVLAHSSQYNPTVWWYELLSGTHHIVFTNQSTYCRYIHMSCCLVWWWSGLYIHTLWNIPGKPVDVSCCCTILLPHVSGSPKDVLITGALVGAGNFDPWHSTHAGVAVLINTTCHVYPVGCLLQTIVCYVSPLVSCTEDIVVTA